MKQILNKETCDIFTVRLFGRQTTLFFFLFQGWRGYGFFAHDKLRDTVTGNLAFFMTACMTLIPVFIYNYMPDYG